MRIWYWSSDVCSSALFFKQRAVQEEAWRPLDAVLAALLRHVDHRLHVLLVGKAGFGLLLGHAALLHEIDIAEIGRPAGRDVGRALALQLLEQGLRLGCLEIGREACRERVRQYVLISVVAV